MGKGIAMNESVSMRQFIGDRGIARDSFVGYMLMCLAMEDDADYRDYVIQHFAEVKKLWVAYLDWKQFMEMKK